MKDKIVSSNLKVTADEVRALASASEISLMEANRRLLKRKVRAELQELHAAPCLSNGVVRRLIECVQVLMDEV